jgi:hypothetical protein
MFDAELGSTELRRALFKTTVITASIHITCALLMTSETGMLPATDDPFLCKLLSLRTADQAYVGARPKATGPLAISILTALIPDEVITRLEISELLDYRKATKEAYRVWSAEVDRLAADIDSMDPDAIARKLPEIISHEVAPRLLACRNEMKTERDRLCGQLVKGVVSWRVPAVTLAHVAGVDWPTAIAGFATSAVVPAVVDYYLAQRRIKRTNSAAYLLDLVADDSGR